MINEVLSSNFGHTTIEILLSLLFVLLPDNYLLNTKRKRIHKYTNAVKTDENQPIMAASLGLPTTTNIAGTSNIEEEKMEIEKDEKETEAETATEREKNKKKEPKNGKWLSKRA